MNCGYCVSGRLFNMPATWTDSEIACTRLYKYFAYIYALHNIATKHEHILMYRLNRTHGTQSCFEGHRRSTTDYITTWMHSLSVGRTWPSTQVNTNVCDYMGVSINGGSPKCRVLKGQSHLLVEMDDDWGHPYFWKPPYCRPGIRLRRNHRWLGMFGSVSRVAKLL